MTADLERDEELRGSKRRWRLWLGSALLALFVGAAIWASQIDWIPSDPQIRTAELELRHESRDPSVEGPLVPVGPARVNQLFEPIAQLVPGEVVVIDVTIAPIFGWQNSYGGGLQVKHGELEAGWVVDGFDCTGPVQVNPYGTQQFQFGYVADEVTDAEIEIACTIWTKVEGE